MNWRELILGYYETCAQQPGIAKKPQFYPPASAGDIAEAEASLNARFPTAIRSLLLETNGVMDMMAIDGGEWFDCMWLLWTVKELVEQNLSYRAATGYGTYDRDFRQLVFFAGAGADGILFAFPLMEDRVCASRVVVWHPIMDELDELAPSLEDFLRGWQMGTISV
jgi:cell wall assembly regulator SMI1